MVIVTVSSWQMNWVFLDVFRGMMEENLEESCIFIFKLVSDPNAPVPHNFILAGNLLTSFGFSSGKRSSKQNKCMYNNYFSVKCQFCVLFLFENRCCG